MHSLLGLKPHRDINEVGSGVFSEKQYNIDHGGVYPVELSEGKAHYLGSLGAVFLDEWWMVGARMLRTLNDAMQVCPLVIFFAYID